MRRLKFLFIKSPSKNNMTKRKIMVPRQRQQIKETATDVDTGTSRGNALLTDKCAKPATGKIIMQKCATHEDTQTTIKCNK